MKKYGLLTAAMVGAMSFAMLTGFDSAETAESVMQKYAEASKEMTEFSAEMTGDIDLDMMIKEMNMNMGITVDMTVPIQFVMNPLTAAVKADVKIGAAGEEMDTNVEMYIETAEDGSVSMYSKTSSSDEEAASWDVETIDAEEAEELLKYVNSQSVDLTDIPLQFELAPEAVEVNGASCYELTSQLTWADMKNVLNWAMTKVEVPEDGKEELDEALSMLDQVDAFAEGIVVNVAIDIEDEGFKAVRAHLDLDGSDWTNIQALLPSLMGMENEDGTPMSVELTVPNSNIDYVYDYDTPVSITVPDEAKAAVVDGEEEPAA